MATFKAKCPKCGAGFEAQEEWAGQEGECPDCGGSVIIETPLKKTAVSKPTSKGRLPKTPLDGKPEAPKPRISGERWLLIGSVAFLLAFFAVLGVVLWVHAKPNEKTTPKVQTATNQALAAKPMDEQTPSEEKPQRKSEPSTAKFQDGELKKWESENRAIVVSLASDADAFLNSGDIAKAEAKFNMLLQIVGDRKPEDATLKMIIESSRQSMEKTKVLKAKVASEQSVDNAIAKAKAEKTYEGAIAILKDAIAKNPGAGNLPAAKEYMAALKAEMNNPLASRDALAAYMQAKLNVKRTVQWQNEGKTYNSIVQGDIKSSSVFLGAERATMDFEVVVEDPNATREANKFSVATFKLKIIKNFGKWEYDESSSAYREVPSLPGRHFQLPWYSDYVKYLIGDLISH